MPWTDPSTHIWAAGEVLTAGHLNTFVEANLAFLFGDTGWTNVSVFTNSWVAGTTTPRFMLLGRVVYMEGQISSGTINTPAFTLPAGYRPSQSVPIATTSNGAFGQVTVAVNGVVTPVVGSTSNFSLCVSFSVS